MRGLLGREFHHIDGFITMSDFSRAKQQEFGFPFEMDVLPYLLPDPTPATDAREATLSPHSRPYFLFVGRLEKVKGLDHVIPLFRQHAAADPLVAGEGDHTVTTSHGARRRDAYAGVCSMRSWPTPSAAVASSSPASHCGFSASIALVPGVLALAVVGGVHVAGLVGWSAGLGVVVFAAAAPLLDRKLVPDLGRLGAA